MPSHQESDKEPLELAPKPAEHVPSPPTQSAPHPEPTLPQSQGADTGRRPGSTDVHRHWSEDAKHASGPAPEPTRAPEQAQGEGQGQTAAQAPVQSGPISVQPQNGLISAPEGVLSGQMLVSNNPEAVYQPGRITKGLRLGPGRAAVYVHHSNHTASALDFFLVVRKVGGGSMNVGSDGAKSSGAVTNDQHADPNYQTARDAIALGRKPITNHKSDGPEEIGIGGIAVSRDRHSADRSPIFDARYNLMLDSEAEVDVVCRARGDKTPLADLPMATGNTKAFLPGTYGRASGVYTGALWQSTSTLDVQSLAKHPVSYPLTTVASGPKAPVPKAEQQQQAEVPSPEQLGRILRESASADTAVLRIAKEVYRLDPTWLADKGILKNGAIDPSSETLKDGAYNRMLIQQAVAVREDMQALADLRARTKDDPDVKKVLEQFAATHTAAFLAKNQTLGAATDAANYGTIYSLEFILENAGDKAVPVSFKLENHNKYPYRGAVEYSAPDGGKVVDAFRDSKSGGAEGLMDLFVTRVAAAEEDKEKEKGAERKEGEDARGPKPTQSRVGLRFMSPGQIGSGQTLEISQGGK